MYNQSVSAETTASVVVFIDKKKPEMAMLVREIALQCEIRCVNFIIIIVN